VILRTKSSMCRTADRSRLSSSQGGRIDAKPLPFLKLTSPPDRTKSPPDPES
jgi:hypothetical protein